MEELQETSYYNVVFLLSCFIKGLSDPVIYKVLYMPRGGFAGLLPSTKNGKNGIGLMTFGEKRYCHIVVPQLKYHISKKITTHP